MKQLLRRPAQLLLAILFFFAACESEEVLDDNKLHIQITSTDAFGNILVNKKNETLYFFASDVSGESSCNGGCAGKWPPLLGEVADLEIGSTLISDDFATITRGDGQKQITYKGWPLYYFSPASDGVLETTASINGDGAGGSFFIAKPDYSIMLGKKVVTEGEDAVYYLTDARGVSLYDFTNDDENISNCAGGCATNWPPLNADGDFIVPSVLSAGNFDSIERSDELGDQATYNGRPLYYFLTDDDVRGSTLGQGGASGKFFVVEPVL